MSLLINEMDRKIYRDELAPALPPKILDAHVHLWSADDFPPGFQFPAKSFNNRFGGTFTPEQFRAIMKELLPEQEVGFVGFGSPCREADRSKVPETVGANEFSEVLLSPEDPAELIQQRVETSGACGVKPYLNCAAEVYGKNSNDVEIRDMMTPAQLEYLNRAGLAVTLHIPRPGRFSDPVNRAQMMELCEKYPNIKFIFAHIGRAYFMRGIREGNPAAFACYPNAYFDTAMINHEGVLAYTFDHFPAERVLFGTDAPIALLRGKSVEINDQYAYLIGENYEIGTTIPVLNHAVEFTTFYYEQLRAVLGSVPAGQKENVFYNNAYQLFKGIKSCQK